MTQTLAACGSGKIFVPIWIVALMGNVDVCTCVCVCVYLCVYVCVKERVRERERERERGCDGVGAGRGPKRRQVEATEGPGR